MYQTFSSFFAVIILATVTACSSQKEFATGSRDQKLMTVTVNQVALPASAGRGAISTINTRVMRDFIKKYRTATDAEWYKLKHGYVVNFKIDDRNARAAYRNSGDWVYTIKYYNEAHLSRDIRHIVKRTYYDYRITLIEEIDTPNYDKVYVVHLEDDTNIKLVRVCNRELTSLEEFVKSK